MIVLGALAAHIFGAALFAAQTAYCSLGPCFSLSYDPNIYKAILTRPTEISQSDFGIEFGLLFNLLLGVGAFRAAEGAGRSSAFQNILKPDTQGWIKVIADGASASDKAVTAFVVTKLGNDGFYAAYEGVVQQLTLDEEQAVTMVVLAAVDRLAVKVDEAGLHRVDQDETRSMPLMQFSKSEIANIAFEIVDLSALNLDGEILSEEALMAEYSDPEGERL